MKNCRISIKDNYNLNSIIWHHHNLCHTIFNSQIQLYGHCYTWSWHDQPRQVVSKQSCWNSMHHWTSIHGNSQFHHDQTTEMLSWSPPWCRAPQIFLSSFQKMQGSQLSSSHLCQSCSTSFLFPVHSVQSSKMSKMTCASTKTGSRRLSRQEGNN